MTERIVGVTDTASGAGVADVRTRERSVGGNTAVEQYIIPQDERVVSFRGMGATFRMIGSTATPQWLFQMQNAAGTAVLVAVRSMVVQHDHFSTVASTVANGIFTLSRSTGTRAGGTTVSKVAVGTGPDAAQTSDANLTLSGGASADGTNSLITGLTAGNNMSRRLGNRMHTLVGQVLAPSQELIPSQLAKDGVILRSGEQLAVTATFGAAADNIVGFSYVVSVTWDEYTLP